MRTSSSSTFYSIFSLELFPYPTLIQIRERERENSEMKRARSICLFSFSFRRGFLERGQERKCLLAPCDASRGEAQAARQVLDVALSI